jgi:ribosomal protein S18 acetylase RimI-like enzyme
MNVSVIQATIADLEDLALLFDQYRMFYEQESNRESAREFLWNRFEHRESVLFIARDAYSQEAVGFTQLYPSFSSVSMKRIWILNDLYVQEQARGKGAAQSLLTAAKTYAELTKAKGMQLSTALTNSKAQQLYERNGYVKNNQFYQYFLSI